MRPAGPPNLRRMREPLVVRLVAVAGVLGISFAAILARAASVAPATTSFFRTFYALPLLAAVWLWGRRRDHRPAAARAAAFGAGLFLAVDLTLWHRSIELIGAGLATVLANTQVVFVGLAAWIVWRERPTTLARWAVPGVLVGVALLSGLGRDDAYGDDPLAGVLFGVGAGIAYAGFLLVFRGSNRRHLAPTAGPLLDATAGAAVGSLVAGLFDSNFSLAPSWPEHGWLLLLALVAQTIGWLFIAQAIPRLPALETSVLLLVQPVASILWARLIFDETLSPVQGMGVLVVLAGVLLLTRRGSVEDIPPVQAAAAQ